MESTATADVATSAISQARSATTVAEPSLDQQSSDDSVELGEDTKSAVRGDAERGTPSLEAFPVEIPTPAR
jgi:hypothetical protein